MGDVIRSAKEIVVTLAPAEKGIFVPVPAFFCHSRGEDAVPGRKALSELEANRLVFLCLPRAGNRIDRDTEGVLNLGADNPINLPAMGTTPKTGKIDVPSQPRPSSTPLAASTRLTVSSPTTVVVRNSLPLTL